MRKILFPTDFSDVAKHAFRYAASLAESIDARIDLMHVYHLPIAEVSNAPYHQIEEMLEERKHQIEEQMDSFAALADGAVVGQRIITYGMFVYPDIVNTAGRGKYDLIVMGLKGAYNRLEKLIGSTTTHTMLSATCPVLAVPELAEFKDIEHVAYATDFRPKEQQVINQLLKFTETVGAHLGLVHAAFREGAIEITEHDSFSIVKSESVMEGLDQYIREKKVDILALYIPKRRLWEQLFHQSFTKRMIFHTSIPLLIFNG